MIKLTKKRNLTILNKYLFGDKTLVEVGREYNITKERVRQIVAKHKPFLNPNYFKNAHKKPGPKKVKRKKFICKYCGKQNKITPSIPRQFCDRRCFHKYIKKYGHPTRKYSGKTRKERHKQTMKIYYQRLKQDPVRFKKHKEREKKYSQKYYQRKKNLK